MRKFYSSSLYKRLPLPLQSGFVSFKGLCFSWMRNGLEGKELKRTLLGNEKLSAEQLQELQFRNLCELVVHADRQVPYYRRVFKEIGFRPGDLKSMADLAKLPMIDKSIVREHYDEFIADDYRHRFLIAGKTGGTTGTPLKLKMDSRLIHLENAFALRQYRWAGFPERGGRCAAIRGDMIVPTDAMKPPFWRYDAWNREMWFSSYHISEKTAVDYLRGLEEFDPHLIFAYPFAIFALSQFAIAQGIKPRLPSLKGIVTSSETFPDYQKEIVRQAFGVGVYDWYGQFERVIFIGTCEHGAYHSFPDYGATEFLPTENTAGGDKIFQLVGTGFLNRVMPLIRYRTGDTAIPDESGQVCACGRHFPIVKAISGRFDDLIVSPDGRRFSYMVHALKDISGIHFAQIVQESINNLMVSVVRGPGYTDADDAKIIKGIRERVGIGMQISVKHVETIRPEKNGKVKLVISKLNKGVAANRD